MKTLHIIFALVLVIVIGLLCVYFDNRLADLSDRRQSLEQAYRDFQSQTEVATRNLGRVQARLEFNAILGGEPNASNTILGWADSNSKTFQMVEPPPNLSQMEPPPNPTKETPWLNRLGETEPFPSGLPRHYMAVAQGFLELAAASDAQRTAWTQSFDRVWRNADAVPAKTYQTMVRHMPDPLRSLFELQGQLCDRLQGVLTPVEPPFDLFDQGDFYILARYENMDLSRLDLDYRDRINETERSKVTLISAWVGALLITLTLLGLLWWLVVKQVRFAESRRHLVHAVSHELRTPLAAILQLSEMLITDRITEPAKRAQYLRLIHGQGIRLKELVERVLSYARFEHRVFNVNLEPVNLSDFFRDFHEMIAHANPEAADNLVIPAVDPKVSVTMDMEAMTRVLYNLVENAWKYGAPPYEIQATFQTDTWRLTIRDHGQGLPDTKKLFTPYVRLHQRGSGVGLGLSIVKELIAAHNGTIQVDQNAGQGLSFQITLPLSELAASEPTAQESPAKYPIE